MLQTAQSGGIPSAVLARKRPTVDELASILDDGITGHAAGTIFHSPAGRVLLLLRSPDEKNFGRHWSLPGGKAEDGETPEEAATREAGEETGGRAPQGEKRKIKEKRTPTGMVFHTFAQPVENEFEPNFADGEHVAHQWAPLDDLPSPMHPAVAETLAQGDFGLDRDFQEGDHPRAPDGKFGGGGTSSETEKSDEGRPAIIAKHVAALKRGAEHTKAFLQDKSAIEAIGAVAKDHRTKAAVSNALQSLLSHATGLDHSTWKLNEDFIEHTVHHFEDITQFGALQVKDMLRKSIKSLIALRGGKKPAADDVDGENDEVTEAFEALLDLLEDQDQGDQDFKTTAATDSALTIALDEASVREKDRDGRLIVSAANISKATVNPYKGHEIPDWEKLGLEPNRIYQLLRDPAELKKAAPSFNGVQLLRKHVPVSAQDGQQWEVVGCTGTDAEFKEPFLQNSLRVWDQGAIDEIEDGSKRELSCGYHYVADMHSGEYQGMRYDGVMREICGNHVALVSDGRAGPDVIVGDSGLSIAWDLLEEAILAIAI